MPLRLDGRLAVLTPFGSTDADASPILRAAVERAGAKLRLRWVLGGPVGGLRLPDPAAAPARTDRLWEHTCFEAFLAPADGAAYWEFNLSPSGDWNIYRFDRYREGMRAELRARAPLVRLERASCGTLTLLAEIDLAPLPELTSGPLDVSLAAVLEANDGTLSYWALEHGTAPPDFHRRESFVVRLEADQPA